MNRRTGLAAVAATMILALVATLATSRYLAARAAANGSAFITADARLRPLEQTVLASGVLEPARLVTVGARASGQVMKLHVKIGDAVSAGQPIAEIDSQPQRNTVNNAEAALESVKAQRASRRVGLRQAEQVLTRQTRLLEVDATSRDVHEAALAARDSLVADIAALDAQIRQATAAVETARTDLGYTRISAPIAGVVVAVVTEEGRTVNAFQSAPAIVMIAELERMRVKAEISEADVTRVRPGQKVWFTILGEPGKRYYGTLEAVQPAPESIADKAEQLMVGTTQQTAATKTAVYYNGLFHLPNPDGELRPMMTAQVHIVLGEAREALAIPMTALGGAPGEGEGPEARDDGEGSVQTVRVVDDRGQVATRRVRTGLSNGVLVQITEGLSAGERVVVGDPAAALPGGSTWN